MTIALAGCIEVGEQDVVVGVEDERAGRNGDDQILAALAVHLLAHAGLAAPAFQWCLPAKSSSVFLFGVGDEDDGAAVATVAAVGAALGDVLLAAERDAPVPAVAGFDVDVGFVDEHARMISASARDATAAPRTPVQSRLRWHSSIRTRAGAATQRKTKINLLHGF